MQVGFCCLLPSAMLVHSVRHIPVAWGLQSGEGAVHFGFTASESLQLNVLGGGRGYCNGWAQCCLLLLRVFRFAYKSPVR